MRYACLSVAALILFALAVVPTIAQDTCPGGVCPDPMQSVDLYPIDNLPGGDLVPGDNTPTPADGSVRRFQPVRNAVRGVVVPTVQRSRGVVQRTRGLARRVACRVFRR